MKDKERGIRKEIRGKKEEKGKFQGRKGQKRKVRGKEQKRGKEKWNIEEIAG